MKASEAALHAVSPERGCVADQPQRVTHESRDRIRFGIMKRFTGTEFAALALAAVLFFVGASMVVWPRADVIPHLTAITKFTTGTYLERFDESGAQARGAVAMICGASLAVFTVYRK